MTNSLLVVGVLLVCVVTTTVGLKVPAGCTYNTGLFTCNYKNSFPLKGLDFSPPPQRLVVDNIFGSINGSHFFNFSSVNTTAFDSNFDATLTLKCLHVPGINGYISFVDTSFEEMDFYQSLLIRDCNIEHLTANAFQHLHHLNFLGFQGGYINHVDANAFAKIDIRPDVTAIVPKGELSFVDVDVISGGFHDTTLMPLSNLEILTVQHSRVASFVDDCFANLHRVHTLTLDDNTFTYIRKPVFRNMSALSRVSFENILWQCTCKNLWFVDHFERQGISVDSEIVCEDPPSWRGIRAENYKAKLCDESICDTGTMPSIDLGVVCLTYLQIAIYCMVFIAILTIPPTVNWCLVTHRKLSKMEKGGLRMMTPRKPPPRQRAPMGHARGFPAAKQNMYGAGGGMSYPAGSFA